MTALEDRETVVVECCDQCGCRQSDVALEASPWTLRSCSECGFVFTSPRLSDAALAGIYSDEYYENADSYAAQQILPPNRDHQELATKVRRLLKRKPAKRLASMDVGCGGGRLVAAFADAGFAAAGIEPSTSLVRAARAAGRDLRAADVSELPDESWDCVTAIHVLEHVTSPKEFMQQMHRICRPGGCCVIEVPNFESKASREQGADWYALHPSTHLSHFTPGTLAACIRNAGFEVRSIHRLGGGGVFNRVSEATARKQPAAKPSSPRRQGMLAAVWKQRSLLLSVPTVRRIGRWVNWEVLGHGEFVRIFASKENSIARAC
ncbi:MAG: hypothetical protein Fues2KO_14810 [Fuerstiella sp.]